MFNYPLVSVIVVCYKHSKFLNQCLDSIKNQTYQNIQLIIADDFSPDDSASVIQKWIEDEGYPAVLNLHKKNIGLAKTLNECIDLSEGKYIKYIAGDDFLNISYLEKCVETLEELNQDYGMIYTNAEFVDGNSNVALENVDLTSISKVSPEKFKNQLLIRNPIVAASALVKTFVLKDTGPYKPEYMLEDYYKWLEISAKYKIAYIDDKLTYCRIHGENTSIVKADKMYEEETLFRMQYDTEGIAKVLIKDYFILAYSKNKLNPKTLALYRKYQWRDRFLLFFINFKLPFLFYRIFKKVFMK